MKKYLAVLTALAVTLGAAGCQPNPEAAAKQEETEQNTYLNICSIPKGSGSYDENRTVMEGEYPCIILEEEGYEALKKSLDAYNADAEEEFTKEFGSMLSEAQQGYREAKDGGYEFLGYSLEQEVSFQRADKGVLSFWENGYSYMGGAHPMYGRRGFSFDPESGKQLSLSDITEDYDALYEFVKKTLSERGNTESGYENTLKEIFYDTEKYPDGPSWVLDSRGLTISFDPYVLGSYAEGIIEAKIPYDAEPKLIKDEYCIQIKQPAEQIKGIGTLHANLNQNGGDEKITVSVLNNQGDFEFANQISVAVKWTEDHQSSVEYHLDGEYKEAYLMQTDGGNYYLYVISAGMNDYEQTVIFDLNAETPAYVDTVDASPKGYAVFDSADFALYTKLYILGTFNGMKHYYVGEDGLPVMKDEVYAINPAGEFQNVITAKIPVPVRMLTEDEEAGKKENLPAGTKLIPFRTDGESYVDMKMENGSVCRVEIDPSEEEWSRTIEGKSDYDYFENLCYAG